MTAIVLRALLLLCVLLPAALQAASGAQGEILDGHYAREGNDGSPAEAAGNNIYLKFFPDRWIGVLFVPYDEAEALDPGLVTAALENARRQTGGAAYLKGRFGGLPTLATAQIERYGYLEDRIIFECGALSPCTVILGDGYLELVKPGIVTEHIVRYRHVAGQ